VATTRSRHRARGTVRPNSGGVVAEHRGKIYGVAIGGVLVIIAFLALTSTGHVIDLAVQHFMLFYAGVFALIALCASVAAGLVATDRMVLSPGHRVMVQSAHRAISFGALVFLVIHIVTEILAQRVHVIDAFVPFLSPFRTFYIGLGTISFDLIILLVITGVWRKRFTGHGQSAWRWRAIHYTSYASFVFGVWHGLLGGRAAKPYVDWSYGFVVALVALGLAVRILSNSLRPRENLSAPPVAESAGSGLAPIGAAMYARPGVVRAAMPGAMATVASPPRASGYAGAALPAPVYEPGYEGPPRYAGAPRNSGPLPRVPGAASGPWARPASGYSTDPLPRVPGAASGPSVRPMTGPIPRTGTGPIPRTGTGPIPRTGTGPIPRTGTGPQPQVRVPRPGTGSGPMPQVRVPRPGMGSGPMPQVRVPEPGMGSGPQRRPATGPAPSYGTRYGGPPQPAFEAGNPLEGQQPWDSGIPDVDPSLRYRMPGPGLPGYRPPADHLHDGDNRR
jgi:hypothetical protein